MNEKRYGALNAFPGWTIDTLANGPHHTSLTQELARDLIASQDRIACVWRFVRALRRAAASGCPLLDTAITADQLEAAIAEPAKYGGDA